MNSTAVAAWIGLIFVLVVATEACQWFEDDCEVTTDPGKCFFI